MGSDDQMSKNIKLISLNFPLIILTNINKKKTYLDTMIADTAVWATWRSIKFTSDAPLHAYSNAIDFHAFV